MDVKTKLHQATNEFFARTKRTLAAICFCDIRGEAAGNTEFAVVKQNA